MSAMFLQQSIAHTCQGLGDLSVVLTEEGGHREDRASQLLLGVLLAPVSSSLGWGWGTLTWHM